MASNQDILNKISSCYGYNGEPAVALLQNDIDYLTEIVKAKQELVREFNLQLEDDQGELRAQMDFHDSFLEEMKEDVQKQASKSDFLKEYMSTIDSSENFHVNRVKTEVYNYAREIWLKLKPFLDSRCETRNRLEQLKEQIEKCEELKRRIEIE